MSSHHSSALEQPSQIRISRLEILILSLVFIVFLAINMLTSARSPTVSQDEVMFADPAINLYLEKGFTSTAWPFQSSDKFWAGNSPLHSLILYFWISLFGISPEAIRSINYILIISAVSFIWLFVIKFRLVNVRSYRVCLVVLLLTGYGITFCYRSGRYDCISILLLSIFAYISHMRISWKSCLYLVVISTLFPLAGLQLATYSCLLGGFIVFFLERRFAIHFACLLAGLISGSLLMYLIYSANGVWYDFLASVKGIGVESFGRLSLIGRIVYPYAEMLRTSAVDYSSFIVLVLIGLLITYKLISRQLVAKWEVLFGLLLPCWISLIMPVLGKFQIYYAWMIYIPLCICFFSIIEDSFYRLNFRKLAVLYMCVGLICLIGFPARMILTITEWHQRDYTIVEHFIENNVTKSDSVYCYFQAYYPVKRLARETFLPTYLLKMSVNERKSISKLIVEPNSFTSLSEAIGGEWLAGEKLDMGTSLFNRSRSVGAQLYVLQIFTRVN